MTRKQLIFKTLAICAILLAGIIFPTILTAQRSDGFFKSGDDGMYENRATENVTLGNDPFGEKPVPVGSGLLVLTIAGAGYAVARRKRSRKDVAFRVPILLLACVLLLGMTQCKKRIETVTSDSGNTIHFTVNVGMDRHEIIPNEDGYVPVKYQVGDVLYVGNGGKYIGTLTCITASDTGNASFEGDIIQPNTDDVLHFYFAGGCTPSKTLEPGTTTDFTVDISNQASKLPVLSYTAITYNDINTETIKLHNQCALVEFVLDKKTGFPVKACNMLSEAKIDFANPGITPTGVVDAITLYPLSSDYTIEYEKKWAILLPGDKRSSVARITTGTNGGEQYSYYDYDSVPTLNNCDYIYGNNAIAINNNAEPTKKKLFVVSDNGNVVQFAPGNLQYQASTQTWRFAEHPWDYVGGTVYEGQTWGNVYETIGGESGVQCNNANIGATYEGWIDLFGWGTWGNGKSPYLKTTSSSDYTWSTDFQVELDGCNDWRTLTQTEWEKLNSYSNNNLKIGKCTLHDVRGAIILPDKCSGTYSNGSWAVLSDENWNTYAAMGAIFLPCGGMRSGTSVSGSHQIKTKNAGYYWSSSQFSYYNDYKTAFYVIVQASGGSTLSYAQNYNSYKYYGCLVRLAR